MRFLVHVPAPRFLTGAAFLAVALGAAPGAGAAEDLGASAREVLRARCLECHGPDKRKGSLDLSSPEAAARGGRRGPVVAPGKPGESRLWLRVEKGEMPPERPLGREEQAVLRRWIEVGAPGLPRPAAGSAPGGSHWAFEPPRRSPLPAVARQDLVSTEVDRFVEAALEARGLTLGPEADRLTLLRRVSFGLTGLPSTPSEAALFLSDPAPEAYERMVERHLASPHYGERWGRHWLDAVGYAESNGYFSADSDRPLAWRYRDYVVQSLNDDLPLDRFVQEQLAGDELAGYRPEGDVDAETARLLAATGFLRNAQDGTGESDGNDLEVLTDRVAVLDGTVQIVGSALLGLTFQCARCHDHKFDPLTQVDYYRLQAVFAAAYSLERWKKPAERVVVCGSRADREEHARRTEKVERELKALEASREALAGPLRKVLLEERTAGLPEAERAAVEKAREKPEDKRSAEERALLRKHEKLLQASDDDLAARFIEFKKLRAEVEAALAQRRKELPPPLPAVAALWEESGPAPPHRLLRGGSPADPGEAVEPGVPAFLCRDGKSGYRVEPPGGGASSGRRLSLARWITSRENPLFTRVLVNRFWQHHLGLGIVSTTDNLGRSGSTPSHPELLDHLAAVFAEGGFRLKELHRLLLRSRAYRQSSAPRPGAEAADPDNRLLWRFPPQRLDAESLRDSMLHASGELDLRRGGPSSPTRRGEDGQVTVDGKAEGALRRSLYLQARRTQPLTLLEVFDAPLPVTGCPRRSASTTPLQSLTLLNSEFVRSRAQAFAARLEREAGRGREAGLSLAFLLALGRSPGPEERRAAEAFLDAQPAEHGGGTGSDEAGRAEAERRAWADFCQALFLSNGFLYLD